MADKNLTYKVDVQNLSEVDKLNAGIDKVTNTTKKGGSEIYRYRRELALARGELLKAEEGTQEYNAALTKLTRLQDNYKAKMDVAKAATRDMGEQAKVVGRAIGGIAGGFQVAAGVVGLFGAESENAQKAIQGIISAIAVTEGIVRFADTFDSIGDLISGFKATSAISEMSGFDKATQSTAQSVTSLSTTLAELGGTAINATANITQVNALGDVTKDLKDNLDGINGKNFSGNTAYIDWVNEAISSNVRLDDSYTVLQNSLGEYQAQYTKGSEELKLLTFGTEEYTKKLTELINIKAKENSVTSHQNAVVKDLTEAEKLRLDVSNSKLKTLNELNITAKEDNVTLKRAIELNGEDVEVLTEAADKVEDYVIATKQKISVGNKANDVTNKASKSTEKITDATDNLTDATDKSTGATDKSADSQKKLDENQKKASNSMLKNVGIMVGVLAAIAAITYAISKLIEWVNKVPKELEIKVTLMQNVEEHMKDYRLELSKIGNDYSKALRDNNEDMQKRIAKHAEDKYGITKEMLSKINKDMMKDVKEGASNWDDAFSEILNKEAVKQAQTELLKEYRDKQSELRALLKEELDYKHRVEEELAKKDNNSFFSVDTDAIRLGIQMLQRKKAIKEARETLDAVVKQLARDTYLADYKDEKGAGGGIKQTYYNLKEYAQDYVGFRIKYGDLLTKKNFKWTEAEIANMTELQKKQEEIMQIRIDEGGEFMNPRFLSGNVESDIELLRYDAELYKAELKDVNLDIEKTKKLIAESASKLNPELRAKSEEHYADLIKETNKKLIEKQSIEFKLAELQADRTKLVQEYDNAVKIANTPTDNKGEADKAANSLKGLDEKIKAFNTTITEQQDALTKVTFQINEYNNAITKQEEYIATLEAGSQAYTDAMNTLFDLQLKQRELNESLVDNERETWQKRIEAVKQYAEAISGVYSGISAIYEGDMAMTNAKYNAEKWHIEESNASNEEREQLLYELEMRRYDALIENFENNKKAKEAGAWVDMLAGIVNIWSSPSVVPQPFDAILKGIQSAALSATTWGSVQQIRAQRLEKPHAPKSSGGAGSTPSISALALNPKSTALTTTEDRLNINRESNLTRNIQAEVKVSDINKVQNKVAVRDAKTSY